MVEAAIKREFTVDEFHHMLDCGLLSEDDRIELIDGDLIEKAPIGKRHVACVNRLTREFVHQQKDDQYIVSVQNPLKLDTNAETQPDISILRYREDDYEDHLPEPDDVLLLVEVAETSLVFDQEEKVPLYAEHEIPETWIVNLSEEVVEGYSSPKTGSYASEKKSFPGEVLQPLAVSGVRFDVDKIM